MSERKKTKGRKSKPTTTISKDGKTLRSRDPKVIEAILQGERAKIAWEIALKECGECGDDIAADDTFGRGGCSVCDDGIQRCANCHENHAEGCL